jgi:hypothetical protein
VVEQASATSGFQLAQFASAVIRLLRGKSSSLSIHVHNCEAEQFASAKAGDGGEREFRLSGPS